jgi:hypothetical protein
MDRQYINDLVTRLRNSSTPVELREEVIRILSQQLFFLEDIHTSVRQGCVQTAERLSGMALGKPGYESGDGGF